MRSGGSAPPRVRSAFSAPVEDRVERYRQRLGEAEDVAGRMSPDELADAIADLERAKALLSIRLNTLTASRPQEPDRLLTPEEAARRLGVSLETVYRKAKNLPFRVKIGGNLRFSSRGLDAFIRSRCGQR